MTKHELIKEVATKSGFNPADCEIIVNRTFDSIRENVDSGKSIFIRGFGTFRTKIRKAKKGQNISKKETIYVPEKRVVVLVPSSNFKIHKSVT